MIALKERQEAMAEEDESPKNIPELMCRYVNDLNRAVSASERMDDRMVQRIARTVAWKCLEETFQPAAANLDAVESALGAGAAEQLHYLKDRLRLLQTTLDRNRVRFSLDPIAEYFAGMHVVKDLGTDELRWRAFLERLDTCPRGLAGIRAFILAAWECCKASQDPIWNRAEIALAKRAGVLQEDAEPPFPGPQANAAGLT